MNLFMKMDVQDLNILFSHLSADDYKVFWIRDPGYSKQLYVSHAFETVWKRPVASLYEYPASWNDYLMGDNSKEFVELLVHRQPQQDEKNNTVLYRIHDPEGNMVWIKDDHFYLFNEDNEQVAVAGIAHAISQTQWLLEAKNCDFESTTPAFEKDLLSILTKECRLTVRKSAHAILAEENDPNLRYILTQSGKKILISKREVQCLLYLTQGLSAKQIAKKMFISHRTVEQHIANIKSKTHCHSSLELIGQIRGFSV